MVSRPDEAPEIAHKRKLYVLVREDLPTGLAAAQASHAVAEFCIGKRWSANIWHSHPEGNYLIILGVHDEEALVAWHAICKGWDIDTKMFREPDLGGAMTAFAAHPRPDQNYIFEDLPLAFRLPHPWVRFKRWIGLGPA